MLIKIFIIAALIFFGMKLVHLILGRMSFSKSIKHHLDYLLAFAELIIWLAFISWLAMLALQSKNNFILFFFGSAIVLLLVPAFILIRDLIFGIFFKAQNKIPEGINIRIDGTQGKIIKAGHFFLNVEDTHGNIKSLAYYKLKSKVIVSLGDDKELAKLDMTFKLPNTKNINELSSTLKKLLLLTPWVAVSKPIIFEKIKRKDNHLLVKVGLFTLNKKYEENIRTMVEKNYHQKLI
jgi:hypothetical protein